MFYRLRDELGEQALNRALKRYLQDKGYQQAPDGQRDVTMQLHLAKLESDGQGKEVSFN